MPKRDCALGGLLWLCPPVSTRVDESRLLLVCRYQEQIRLRMHSKGRRRRSSPRSDASNGRSRRGSHRRASARAAGGGGDGYGGGGGGGGGGGHAEDSVAHLPAAAGGPRHVWPDTAAAAPAPAAPTHDSRDVGVVGLPSVGPSKVTASEPPPTSRLPVLNRNRGRRRQRSIASPPAAKPPAQPDVLPRLRAVPDNGSGYSRRSPRALHGAPSPIEDPATLAAPTTEELKLQASLQRLDLELQRLEAAQTRRRSVSPRSSAAPSTARSGASGYPHDHSVHPPHGHGQVHGHGHGAGRGPPRHRQGRSKNTKGSRPPAGSRRQRLPAPEPMPTGRQSAVEPVYVAATPEPPAPATGDRWSVASSTGQRSTVSLADRIVPRPDTSFSTNTDASSVVQRQHSDYGTAAAAASAASRHHASYHRAPFHPHSPAPSVGRPGPARGTRPVQVQQPAYSTAAQLGVQVRIRQADGGSAVVGAAAAPAAGPSVGARAAGAGGGVGSGRASAPVVIAVAQPHGAPTDATSASMPPMFAPVFADGAPAAAPAPVPVAAPARQRRHPRSRAGVTADDGSRVHLGSAYQQLMGNLLQR